MKLWDFLKVKNACVKAVNYITRYTFSSVVVIIAFYYALKANVLPPLVGPLYRPEMTVRRPQIQVNEQAVAYL